MTAKGSDYAIQTNYYEIQTFLNLDGVTWVCFLKKLLKCVGSSNPRQ